MTCKVCGGLIRRTGLATGKCEDCGQPYAGIVWGDEDLLDLYYEKFQVRHEGDPRGEE